MRLWIAIAMAGSVLTGAVILDASADTQEVGIPSVERGALRSYMGDLADVPSATTLGKMALQFEDLTYLASGSATTLVSSEFTRGAEPYESLPITRRDRQKIGSILMTIAENSVFTLLFEKKRLEKLGREVNHVHPMRFLGAVFGDPRLVHYMWTIHSSGFKWDGFIDGFATRFQEELRAGNINAYIPGFAKSLGLQESDVMVYVNRSDFEGLVLHLMEKGR